MVTTAERDLNRGVCLERGFDMHSTLSHMIGARVAGERSYSDADHV